MKFKWKMNLMIKISSIIIKMMKILIKKKKIIIMSKIDIYNMILSQICLII